MGLWSGFSNFCSRVASAVTSTASRVWNGIKETAAKTVSWMAEKAETFVGSVKSVWEKVKPFISNVIRPIVQNAAKLAEKAKINITDSTVNKLGRALKKHNFLKLKKNGIFVYALTENSWEEVDNRNKIAED